MHLLMIHALIFFISMTLVVIIGAVWRRLQRKVASLEGAGRGGRKQWFQIWSDYV